MHINFPVSVILIQWLVYVSVQGQPVIKSRQYQPTLRDIRNHMYKATVKLRFAKMDQENLFHKVEDWKRTEPDSQFFFRGYGQEVKPDVLMKLFL